MHVKHGNKNFLLPIVSTSKLRMEHFEYKNDTLAFGRQMRLIPSVNCVEHPRKLHLLLLQIY